MKLNLDQLEARIQALVENQILGTLPGLQLEDRLIQKLATALKKNIIEQKDLGPVAPNVYTLVVSERSAPLWKNPRTLETLKNIILSAGRDIGLKFETAPTLTVTTDENYAEGEVGVIASHTLQPVEETQGMATNNTNEPEPNDALPENAFLIIEGVKVHPLKEAVVNIGRRLENHVVIDDPRISLRAVRPELHRRHIRQWTAHQPDCALPGGRNLAGGRRPDLRAG
jgi:hypothetical protein